MDLADFHRKLIAVLLVFTGWCLVTGAYAVYYIKGILALDVGDAYARNWQFQLMMFTIFRLPFMVLILLVLIAVALVLPHKRNPSGDMNR